jgi:lipoprotein-releasing system permease protein
MNFILHLAFRYLKPKRSAFSIITVLSILGVMLGVGVLIVVIGVMAGFDRNLKQNILGMEPQIVLRQRDLIGLPEEEVVPWRTVRDQMRAEAGAKSVHPFIFLTTLMEPAEVPENGVPDSEVVQILGLDPENTAQADKIKELMIPESEGGGQMEIGGDQVVLTTKLAQSLGVTVGMKVNAFSPDNMKQVRKVWEKKKQAQREGKEVKDLEEEMDSLVAPTEYTVSGVFRPTEQHSSYAVVALDDALVLTASETRSKVTNLAINIEDPFQAELWLRGAAERLPISWGGHTWIDSHRRIFEAIQNERSMMYLVLMIITLVAAFSTMISMIIFAVQKRREIGMLRALGANLGHISGIFMSQGLVVGFFGGILGVAGGLGFLSVRNELRTFLADKFNLNIFPADIYGLPSIPAYLTGWDVWNIVWPAFLLCTLAALLPAFLSFRDEPAKALRGDR